MRQHVCVCDGFNTPRKSAVVLGRCFFHVVFFLSLCPKAAVVVHMLPFPGIK